MAGSELKARHASATLREAPGETTGAARSVSIATVIPSCWARNKTACAKDFKT